MTASIWQQLRALGSDFNPAQIEATRQLFIPLVPRPQDVGATVTRDISYGPDSRNRLDVFATGEVSGRPVVVFVHGGGFVQGDKGDASAPFYNNVGAWAARAGFVGVTMTYRLAPAHQWPAGSADINLAINWIAANIAKYGGDSARIILMGQSAGATHVAGYLAGHGCPAGQTPRVAAAVLLSGIYAIESNDRNPMHEAYYGTDYSVYPSRATVSALANSEVPALFTISELDPPQFHRHMAAVYAAHASQRGVSPELKFLRNHNHVSSIMQLGASEDSFGPHLEQFVRRFTA
jgi:acetyl esterase/lipase